jgi:hypothetical protein
MTVTLIVAVQMDRPLVGGNQNIQIAIPVEVAEGRATPHLGVREAASQGPRHILKSCPAFV